MCFLRRLVMSLLLSLCSLASPVLAQSYPFDAFPNLWTPDNQVRSLDIVGDTLYIGGDFEYVGPPTGNLAVLDKQTGEPDISLPRFNNLGRGITAVVPDGVGGYFVGGEFTFASGEERHNLAHVLADGTLNPDFMPDPVLDTEPITTGNVYALSLEDGILYVGGRFDIIGGEPRRDLAALNPVTGAVLPLYADFDRINDSYGVRDIVLSGGVLYVAGEFAAVNGQPRTSLAAFDLTTGVLLPWAPGLTIDSPDPFPYVFWLGLGDSSLYLGGGFDTIEEQPRNGIAEVTLADPVTGEGGEPTAWAPDIGVSSFIVMEEYVWGGTLADGGEGPLGRISRETGAVLTFPVAAGLHSGRGVAFDPVGGPSGEGTLYLGCRRSFNLGTGGDRFPVVVGVDPATGQATGYEVLGAPGYLGTDYVGALAVEPGPEGRLFAGGSVASLGGVRRSFFAALDLATGRALPAFEGGEVIGSILDVAASPDGRTVYFGGLFALGVLDVPTWSLRNFGEPGTRTVSRRLTQAAAQAAAQAAPSPPESEADASSTLVRVNPNSRSRSATPGQPAAATASPVDRGAGGAPRRLGNNSAFVVTEEVLYDCPVGCLAYDRQTEDELWATSAVGLIGRSGQALLLDGPGGPGGAEGTLYLSGPIIEIPIGVERAAFAALDPQTGEVFDWDVGVTLSGPGGSQGGGIALLDRDGEGPEEPVLYLGGQDNNEVQGQERDDLLAVDPLTAALLPWDPTEEFLATASGNMMAAQRTEDGGLVYVGGAFRFVSTEPGPRLLAFDAETGEPRLDWQPDVAEPSTMLFSEEHEALFLGGFFLNSLRGSGHAYLVAVTPAAPILPVPSEPDGVAVPEVGSLSAAYPNPFRGATRLTLAVPSGQRVEVALYDVLGRRVAVLHDGPLTAGAHQIVVEAQGLPSGVYVVRVEGETFTAGHRVTIVR